METQESKLFEVLDKSTKIILEELSISYLEALIQSVENLMDDGKVFNEENMISEKSVEKLEKIYESIDLKRYSRDSLASTMQLALVKAMKEDYIQANHQLTPDSIGNLIAYLIEIIVEPKGKLHLADLSVGTANLLLTVYHFLSQDKKREISLSGVDNDELMIATASTNSAIQNTQISLQYQDSLTNILLDPADIIISDLPIGYYPVDDRAAKFKTHFEGKDTKSYSHYLLIEQSINYLKDSAYAFFLLPTNLFSDENIKVLVNYLNDVAYIQAIIELPEELFANEKSRKTVLVIQKKGNQAEQMDEVLLTKVPDFKDFEVMKQFLGEIKEWKDLKNQN